MATSTPSVPEKCVSCSHFASAIEAVKAVHVVLASVMTDLAALRRSVLEDPEFTQLYAKHLAAASRAARPLLAEALKHYDEMISLQQESNGFSN